jgi:hypothetical protein
MFTSNAQPGAERTPGAHWFTSSWSAYNGNCVEVALLGQGVVGVRDSKAGADAPVLRFSTAEWRELTRRVRGLS